MLIPRFSLRWMLLATTASGLFFFLVTLANQGRPWAVGLVVALASLVLVALVHASIFMLAWAFTVIQSLFRGQPKSSSPFASAKPPPQIIAPVDPET